VRLEDSLEDKLIRVKQQQPFWVCDPTSVDGSEIVDPDSGLACFKLSDASGEPAFVPVVQSIEDQLGISDVDVVRSRLLCERAVLAPAAGP
jgi:hypothetical protein